MYNEEIKSRFISELTESESRRKVARTFFNATEPYETERNADICTFDSDTLHGIMDKLVGGQKRSASTRLSILNAYLQWCTDTGAPGAHVVDIYTDDLGSEKFKRQYVSSPSHLQRYLDAAFSKESAQMSDSVLRCIYWLAFGGMSEKDLGDILVSDVKFDLMIVSHLFSDKIIPDEYPIYREAVPAFKNCVELDAFNRSQYDYGDGRGNGNLVMKRAEGNELLRLTTGVPTPGVRRKYMVSANARVHKKAESREIDCSFDLTLSYHRVWFSGLFYRMYETERSHVNTEDIFRSAAMLYMQRFDDIQTKSGRAIRMRFNCVLRDMRENYARWKQVFT